ncbi:hypothetical protein SYN63AY4M2_07970 [Synechococcus sp. 63AY4M2]|nr:hypothetical protein SYN63AY4M2_07970 [Synechococcus sp. 63AY4M2]PIK89832.1 hypothetical protein SYN65AY6A5_11685 [Synechococcus sp. 65AY6A5]PIK93162.1 hypothetical protein SYN65AY6LI_05445 [Synechococcus sp. 65AY6Li]PIK96467.1 hypothetical protein SYN60AY4M2_08570 [Synechococcus sp. 60AY4M2]
MQIHRLAFKPEVSPLVAEKGSLDPLLASSNLKARGTQKSSGFKVGYFPKKLPLWDGSKKASVIMVISC